MSNNTPSMEDMLKAGVHFGHKASHWHPKMAPYIYTVRNGVHIMDLKKTASHLEKAADYVNKVVSEGGEVLFVGTKTQSQPLIEQYAKQCEMPYVNNRWLGGMITNFGEIKKVIKKYLDLKKAKESGDWEKKYTKKEQVELNKELKKLHSSVSGISQMKKLPQAMIVVDLRAEKTAVAEAATRCISMVGICDSNVNPKNIDYIIPANDDAARGIDLILSVLAEACATGLKERKAVPIAK